MNNVKIPEFNVLRSLAIILLLLHHGGLYGLTIAGISLKSLGPSVSYFLLGSFVFISGFLSVRSLQKGNQGYFLASRLVRIYIPYLIALTLFIVYLDVEVDPTDAAIHMFGGQMLLAPRFTSPVLTLWFVGLILVLYLIFGLLDRVAATTPRLLIAALAIYALAMYVRLDWGLLARRFFYYYPVFMAGVACARSDCLDRLVSPRFFLLDKIALFTLGIWGLYNFGDKSGTVFNPGVILAVVFYILSAVLLALSAIRLTLQWTGKMHIFEKIAYASFFAYLFHRPIWELMLNITHPQNHLMLFLYLTVIGGLIIFSVSYLLQKVYDGLTGRISLS